MGTGMKRIGNELGSLRPGTAAGVPEEYAPVAVKKQTRDYVKAAVRKLLGKPAYGKIDEIMIRVCIDALHDACLSEGHVERTIAKILRELPRWPDVTDIRQIALETRDVEMRADPECPKCDGSGFHSRVVDGYQYAGKCDCWRFVRVEAKA